jgi:molybdate transport system ATP-binding protein
MQPPVLSIRHAIVRYLHNTLFANLNFTVQKGEHWALAGASGSGKSALLQTIAGRFNVTGGTIEYHFFDEFLKTKPDSGLRLTHNQLIALVEPKHHFKNLSNTSSFYYQQRYNSSDSEDALTVAQYLEAIHPLAGTAIYWTIEKVTGLLNLEKLKDEQLIKLSNGETKRLMVAAALLKNPALLLLDNPLTGLDVQTRESFNGIIDQIIASGVTVIMATSPYEIPPGITHVAVLANGVITGQMPKAAFKTELYLRGDGDKADPTELAALLMRV